MKNNEEDFMAGFLVAFRDRNSDGIERTVDQLMDEGMSDDAISGYGEFWMQTLIKEELYG